MATNEAPDANDVWAPFRYFLGSWTRTGTGNRRMTRCAEWSGFHEIARTPYPSDTSVRGEPLERIEFSITRQEWMAESGRSHAELSPQRV